MELTIANNGARSSNGKLMITFGDMLKKIPTFRKFEGKECPFSDSDAPKKLDKLLQKGLIKLL